MAKDLWASCHKPAARASFLKIMPSNGRSGGSSGSGSRGSGSGRHGNRRGNGSGNVGVWGGAQTGNALQEVCECVSARERAGRAIPDHWRVPEQISVVFFLLSVSCSGAVVGGCGRGLWFWSVSCSGAVVGGCGRGLWSCTFL